MTAVKEKAYAKINLYLDVLGIREDGFHDIKTVMHSVTLFDEITVSVEKSGRKDVRIRLEGNKNLPSDSKNLAYRAAMLFMERLGVSASVGIKLVKNIPIAAGLAGGSSDAAAVLRALNKIYGRPFAVSALLNMGAEIGSDVPYCIIGKTALCEGRGERLTVIDTPLHLNLVIANTGEHVSTPEAYRMLDDMYSSFDGTVKSEGETCYSEFLSRIKSKADDKYGFYNIFENAILGTCKMAEALKNELIALGATEAMMSGSGPSIFAIFKTKNEAETVKESLIKKGYKAFYAESV